MELDSIDLPIWIPHGGDLSILCSSKKVKGRRKFFYFIPVAHPYRDYLPFTKRGKNTNWLQNFYLFLSILPHLPCGYLSTQMKTEKLHSVTDPQDRDPGREDRRIWMRRSWFKNRSGTTAQNYGRTTDLLQGF